jgi:hypothetical protein
VGLELVRLVQVERPCACLVHRPLLLLLLPGYPLMLVILAATSQAGQLLLAWCSCRLLPAVDHRWTLLLLLLLLLSLMAAPPRSQYCHHCWSSCPHLSPLPLMLCEALARCMRLQLWHPAGLQQQPLHHAGRAPHLVHQQTVHCWHRLLP